MKKKILIVDKSFAVGGIQTALINMVKELKDDYDIDICMFNNAGPLKERLDCDVNVFEPSFLFRLCGMGHSESKKRGIGTYILRTIVGVINHIFTNRLYMNLACVFQTKLKDYDVAIAFHHEDSIKATVSGFYRFVEKVTDAPLKLGWIHYDPKLVSFNDRKLEPYMEKMDKLVCVSKGTANAFISHHPNLKVPVDYCYNFQDITRIIDLSGHKQTVTYDKDCFNMFSACRFVPQKAIPRAVKAFAPILKQHRDVKWYIAGDGAELGEVEKLIKENRLEDSIILLGAMSNPYPYFKNADLYVQPSIYEAAPMVYGEALICKTPILTTDNISAKEMVDEKYGMVCENSEEGMRESLSRILENRDIVRIMKDNFSQYEYSNDLNKELVHRIFN